MAEPLWNGEWVHIHTCPFSGAQTYIMDRGDGTTAIKKITPINELLDSAAADRAETAGKKWGDGQIIGTVPDSIAYSSGYMRAKTEGDDRWIKRFWNDSDHKYLRVKEGKL
jgi:hypothetical protein